MMISFWPLAFSFWLMDIIKLERNFPLLFLIISVLLKDKNQSVIFDLIVINTLFTSYILFYCHFSANINVFD